MARTGWSSANFLRYSGAAVAGAPMSIACWYKAAVAPGGQITVTGIFNSMQNVNGGEQISLNQNATNNVYLKIGDGAGNTGAQATGAVTVGTWCHICGVYSSATSYACYRDGANKGTATTSRIPSGLDRTSIGLQDDQTPNQALNVASLVAELAIWNVALTDAEVVMLGAARVSPLLVRPANLVAYWPLIGAYSPEIELKARQEMTVQGTLSAAAHAPAFHPARRRPGRLAFVALPPSPPRLALTGAGS